MSRRSAAQLTVLIFIVVLASPERVWPLLSVDNSRLLPFSSFQRDFKITAGKDQGRVVALTSRPDRSDGTKSTFTFGDYITVHLARNRRGMLLLERLDLIKSRSHVIYDPALPVLPMDLQAVEPFPRETQYHMYSNETGRLKRSGRVIHSVQRIVPSRFDTPAGPIDGLFIEIDHRMEMEYLSELRIKLGLGCREGEGPVFGTGQYKITRLGIFAETKYGAAGVMSQ